MTTPKTLEPKAVYSKVTAGALAATVVSYVASLLADKLDWTIDASVQSVVVGVVTGAVSFGAAWLKRENAPLYGLLAHFIDTSSPDADQARDPEPFLAEADEPPSPRPRHSS